MGISPLGLTNTHPMMTPSLVRRPASSGPPSSTVDTIQKTNDRDGSQTFGASLEQNTQSAAGIQQKIPVPYSEEFNRDNETRSGSKDESANAPSGQVQTATDAETDAATDAETDATGQQLSESAQQEVTKLEKRDVEVRTHEAAHLAAAGQYATGGASFDYETGPDGKRYAVGGDVSISVSEESTPEATVAKMETVVRAALAPASPSGQDRRVASEATQKRAAAQRELSEERGAAGSGAPDKKSAESAVSSPAGAATSPSSAARTADSKDGTGTLVPQDVDSGLGVISRQARTAGAQKAYTSAAPASRRMDWQA